jgi:hypothetical protein
MVMVSAFIPLRMAAIRSFGSRLAPGRADERSNLANPLFTYTLQDRLHAAGAETNSPAGIVWNTGGS